MKRYVEVEPVCPFLGGKPCIKDGWQWNYNVYHPCMYWDDTAYDEEPCLMKRMVEKALNIRTNGYNVNDTVTVPWDTDGKKESVNNGRKKASR